MVLLKTVFKTAATTSTRGLRTAAGPALQVKSKLFWLYLYKIWSLHFQQEGGNKTGFFSTFFDKKIEVQDSAHSTKFSNKETILELQTHNVKPDSLDRYLKVSVSRFRRTQISPNLVTLIKGSRQPVRLYHRQFG